MPRRTLLGSFSATILALTCSSAIAADLTADPAARAAGVSMPIPAGTPAWIAALKCGDLLTTNDAINWPAMFPFSLWLHGYLTGVASSLPLDNLREKRIDIFNWAAITDVDSGVLTMCTQHKDWPVFEAAVSAAEFYANVVSSGAISLHGSDGRQK
jgi:hypothetical protein